MCNLIGMIYPDEYLKVQEESEGTYQLIPCCCKDNL